jgi:hypothetical protein
MLVMLGMLSYVSLFSVMVPAYVKTSRFVVIFVKWRDTYYVELLSTPLKWKSLVNVIKKCVKI